MREKIVFFAIGLVCALVSFYAFGKFEFAAPDTVNAQRTYEVEVVYDLVGSGSFEKDVAAKLGEGFRIVGFSSHYIPRDDPGVLVLMIK